MGLRQRGQTLAGNGTKGGGAHERKPCSEHDRAKAVACPQNRARMAQPWAMRTAGRTVAMATHRRNAAVDRIPRSAGLGARQRMGGTVPPDDTTGTTAERLTTGSNGTSATLRSPIMSPTRVASQGAFATGRSARERPLHFGQDLRFCMPVC